MLLALHTQKQGEKQRWQHVVSGARGRLFTPWAGTQTHNAQRTHLERGHVVLDRVQRPQGQVKDEDVQAQALGQLPDDGGEGPTDLAQHIVAELGVLVDEVHLAMRWRGMRR